MTGSWLIVKWAVAGAAGLCVGVLLISWMVEGSGFVEERLGQKVIPAFVIASFLSLGSFGNVVFARLCFVSSAVLYVGIAIVLLMGLARKLRVSRKADG